ncbi:MAG: YiiG family protein [Hyphomicrobiaceae bacterium]|nr:YiiG family protein [Hyphomicrobiaceae bacterium]
MARQFGVAGLALVFGLFSLCGFFNADGVRAETPQSNLEGDLSSAIAKSNAYIGLMNRTLRAVESWQRYASWVNVKKGPTGRERYIDYGLYSLYDVKGEIEKARGVIGTEPVTPELDAAFTRYIEAYEALAPLITTAEGYYERKDYKSDKMVEGKALHAKLVPAAEAFLKSRAEVETLMGAYKRDLDNRALAAIAAQEGQGPNWHVKNVMMLAQDVIEKLPQGRQPADMKAFDAALDSYAKAVRSFDEFAHSYPGKFSAFESQPRSLLGKLREIRDKLAKAKGRVRDQFVGMDLTFLISEYNMMVSTSQMATRFGK